MNCLELERRLDEGDLERLSAEALEHARTCEHCARALARARSLEGALAAHFAAEAAAPAGFAERVMARVERGEARGVRWLTLPDAVPWWARVPAQPSVALAAVVSALLLWRGDRWLAATDLAIPAIADVPARLGERLLGSPAGPVLVALARAFTPAQGTPWPVELGWFLGITPLLALLGWTLWRASERLTLAGAPIPRR